MAGFYSMILRDNPIGARWIVGRTQFGNIGDKKKKVTSRVFSEDLDIQSIEDAHLLMNPRESDMEVKLQGQLLAAWLNFAHGTVDLNEQIDTDGDGLGDILLFELMEFVENTLLQENLSHMELACRKGKIRRRISGSSICYKL